MALRSEKVSRNWDVVCRLADTTLWSAYNQTDPDFRIFVVCHETPRLWHEYDQRVKFLPVDFPPPPRIDYDQCMRDKWRKLAVGLVEAGKLQPQYLMNMDADDLVSRRLVAHAHAAGSANGWIIKTGYRYTWGRRWMLLDRKFNCGTNAILNTQHLRFPQSTAKEEIGRCLALTHGHTVIEQAMRQRGTPLEPLPFPGAVYVRGYGDASSQDGLRSDRFWFLHRTEVKHRLKNALNYRRLNQALLQEFSLDPQQLWKR